MKNGKYVKYRSVVTAPEVTAITTTNNGTLLIHKVNSEKSPETKKILIAYTAFNY